MREIVLDTETTGFAPETGDRLVEIGCIELFNHMPTGKSYHQYVNPERDMPDSAFRVHGLSEEFLSDKPKFAEICGKFIDFIEDAPLVIHNAEFDMKFLNAELGRAEQTKLLPERAIDTLLMARKKFPGAANSLDALCRRYEIDNSNRDLHGALIDADLLARVYLELIGGRQPGLHLDAVEKIVADEERLANPITRRQRPTPLPSQLSSDEAQAHKAFIEEELGENALWRQT